MSVARAAAAGLLAAALLAAAGLVGLLLREPWVSPGVGATVALLVERPRPAAAAPGRTVAGHALAVVAGGLALLATGPRGAAPGELPTGRHVLAAALALAVTVGVLRAAGTPHPPAGATAVTVGLGLLRTPAQLASVVLSVVLVVSLAAAGDLLPPALARPRRRGQADGGPGQTV